MHPRPFSFIPLAPLRCPCASFMYLHEYLLCLPPFYPLCPHSSHLLDISCAFRVPFAPSSAPCTSPVSPHAPLLYALYIPPASLSCSFHIPCASHLQPLCNLMQHSCMLEYPRVSWCTRARASLVHTHALSCIFVHVSP